MVRIEAVKVVGLEDLVGELGEVDPLLLLHPIFHAAKDQKHSGRQQGQWS